MADLAELLERVKAATGPNIRLETEIAIALRYCNESYPQYPLGSFRDGYIQADMGRDGWSVGWKVPPFTASLDAALALVERVLPGSIWRIGFEPDADCYRAQIVTLEERVRAIRGEAETAPLAVLAALLTAQTAVGSAYPKETR